MTSCNNMVKIFLLSIFIVCNFNSKAQEILIKGKISDKNTKEALIGANVQVKGTNFGAITDLDGNFELKADVKLPVDLEVSYLGYSNQTISITSLTQKINIALDNTAIRITDDIVVSASRLSERIQYSPSSVQKLNSKQIQNVASGDFYQSLSTMKEIDITTASMGFQVFNTRGFNTTAPVRVVQFIDGMDNQAPGLNFPVGNLVGASDIDLESVEVISGASSALYGANAFQGIISMQSKNPFDYKNLQIKLKGGNRAQFNGQIRYANAFGKKKYGEDKFGFKIVAEYFRANDWVPDDAVANTYGDIETDVDVSQIVRKLEFSEDSVTAAKFRGLNFYLDFYPEAFPGKIHVAAPGYREKELSDGKTETLKTSFGLYARPKKNMNIEMLYKFGRGTAVYQGSNRYSINSILFHQAKIQFDYKGLLVKAYATVENAGNSYDMVFGAINMSKLGISNYVSNFISAYFTELGKYNNDFKNDPELDDIALVRQYALQKAFDSSFYLAGTPEFDSAYSIIKNDANFVTGAKFQDKSSLQHVDASYTHDFKYDINLIVGASFRNFIPRSFGTIFSDVPDIEGKPKNLNTWEVGAYTQFSVDLFKKKLKLVGSVRADKSENFKVQFSPRIAAIATFKDHTFRFSYQSAFRTPTLQNQYISLDLGAITLLGNLNGALGYDFQSVKDYQKLNDSLYIINTDLLKPIELKPLKPEQVNAFEVGYRGKFFKNFYVDINAYLNRYFNFIGDLRYYVPTNDSLIPGTEAANFSMLQKDYTRLIQRPVNAKQHVNAWGASIGINYYIWKSLMASANYTYADLSTKRLTDPIIPGFNTANHKVNVGLSAQKIWKGLGFAVNFKWVQSYLWESTFGDGQVPTYHTMDMQVTYEFPRWFTIQVGGSNIYNNKHIEAYGSPLVGALVYGSMLFDLDRKGNESERWIKK